MSDKAYSAILDVIKKHPAAVKQLVDTYRRGAGLPEWVLRLGFDILAMQLEPGELKELKQSLEGTPEAMADGRESAEAASVLLNILSQMPAQTIDRAARGPHGWEFPTDDAPKYRDPNNQHSVTYYDDTVSLEALRDAVLQLDTRTADVWRLVTATILNEWPEGQTEPPRVWIDANRLCEQMGFKKHHKGGHRMQHVLTAGRALVDLERFWVTVPLGAREYPESKKTGKRRAQRVTAQRDYRVMAVMAKEQVKPLFDEMLPLRWQVTAGDWIKAYPREQFAPLFRALVQIPTRHTPNLWAKAIGTELTWQYRQDGARPQVQRVKTMLRQAGILEQARQDRNKGRVKENFEKALDVLYEYGACSGWDYDDADSERMDEAAMNRVWFDVWLEAKVTVTPPPAIAKALGGVDEKRDKAAKRRGKRGNGRRKA